MATATEVRQALRSRRKALDWSQRHLAERLGTVQSHVSDLENGRVGVGPDVLKRWADALGFELTVTMTLHDRGVVSVTA